jgi:hypothetical protein
VRLHKQESSDSLETRALNKVFTSSRVFGLHGISPATMFQEAGVLPDGKITDSPRSNDIDFESTEFNNQFHVSAHDRKWAYDVLNQKNMDLLLNSCRFSLEFNGNAVIAYQQSTFASGYFEEALLLLTRMLDNLPDSVIQELKEMKRCY